jgi:hypothetical protein
MWKKITGVIQSFTCSFSLPKYSCERLNYSCEILNYFMWNTALLMWNTELLHVKYCITHVKYCITHVKYCITHVKYWITHVTNWNTAVHAITRRPKRQQPTTFHSIFDTDFSHCSPLFLCYMRHRERDIRLSKQRHDQSERCVSSRVFLAAAMVDRSLPHGDGLSTHRSIVSPIT